LVGSGWVQAPTKEVSKPQEKAPNELLELARSQRMNTDLRRSIFCVIAGSTDYLECFSGLMKFDLKHKDEREIVTVLMHCLKQEPEFNEYYALVAVRLCSHNKSFVKSFRFKYWEIWKDLQSLELRPIANLAAMLAYMVAHDAMSLTILKVIDFDQLEPKSVLFFKLLFIKLLDDNEERIASAFSKVAEPTIRNKIKLFFSETLYNNPKISDKVKQRIKAVIFRMKDDHNDVF